MIKTYLGTMESAKTSRMLSEICMLNPQDVCIADFLNKRNGKRDLRNLVNSKIHFLEEGEMIPEYKKYVFVDEVHFFNVFNKENLLYDLVTEIEERNLEGRFSGLLYDCYNNYKTFPICDYLVLHSKETTFFNSFKPCAECGTTLGVIYTRPTKENKSVVGDDYENVCEDCAFKNRLR